MRTRGGDERAKMITLELEDLVVELLSELLPLVDAGLHLAKHGVLLRDLPLGRGVLLLHRSILWTKTVSFGRFPNKFRREKQVYDEEKESVSERPSERSAWVSARDVPFPQRSRASA